MIMSYNYDQFQFEYQLPESRKGAVQLNWPLVNDHYTSAWRLKCQKVSTNFQVTYIPVPLAFSVD